MDRAATYIPVTGLQRHNLDTAGHMSATRVSCQLDVLRSDPCESAHRFLRLLPDVPARVLQYLRVFA